MSRHGEGKTRRKGERPHGAVKAKTMSIPLSEEEAERFMPEVYSLKCKVQSAKRGTRYKEKGEDYTIVFIADF